LIFESLRAKRSDDSQRAFASFPNPCRIRFSRNFGGENCSSLSRWPPKRFGTAAPLLLTSAPLPRTFIGYAKSASYAILNLLCMRGKQLYPSESTCKMLHVRARQRRVTISELVREAIQEKDRTDIGDSTIYVRKLRKGNRLARLK